MELKLLVRNISILKKKPLVNGIKKYVKKKGKKIRKKKGKKIRKKKGKKIRKIIRN
jgi:hypothetical protein